MDNLKEKRFLEMLDLPRLNKEETELTNNPIQFSLSVVLNSLRTHGL